MTSVGGKREGNKASHQIKPDMKTFPCSTFPWLIVFEEVDAIVLNEIVIKFCVPRVNSNERVSACFFFACYLSKFSNVICDLSQSIFCNSAETLYTNLFLKVL